MNKLIIALLISFFLLESNKTHSQNKEVYKSDLNVWIDNQFIEGMDSFNIPGATFILMLGDTILHLKGYGVADITTNTPVDGKSSIFEIASLSKTFVATAIMQLVEDGKLELDEDINNYLRTFQIEHKSGVPITIKHLLTHTAGIDERKISRVVRTKEKLIPLAQYLKKRMPPQIRPAGEAFTYSNHGYDLLGLIVEEVAELPFDEYVKKKILNPLGMNSTDFWQQPELSRNYVKSYLQRNGQLLPAKIDFRHSYPSGGLRSTALDMRNFISMYLNHGKFKGTQILDSATVVQMHKTAYKNYNESESGWLLGFAEESWNGIKVVAHSGDIHGFASELKLIPEKNIGLFICINASNITHSKSRIFISSFIDKLWWKLMPYIQQGKENTQTIPEIGSVAEPLSTFSGTYRYTRYPQTTLGKLSVLIGMAPEVKIISKNDALEIPDWNAKFIPISDLTFYSKEKDHYIAFGKNAKDEISYFFPGGPDSFHKLKCYESVKFQVYWVVSIVFVLLISIVVSIARKIFSFKKKSHSIRKINFLIASLIILFLGLTSYVLIKTDPQEFFYGIPSLLKFTLVLPFVFILLEIFAIWKLVKAWRSKMLSLFDLIYQSINLIAAIALIPWLTYWNLIGFNY